jgi:drug/metabolite transporter (DMT)-like permease
MAAATPQQDPRSPYLLLVTMILWGSGISSSEVLVEHLTHSVAAVIRFGGGALTLLLVIPLLSGSGRTSLRNWSRAFLAGFLEVFAFNIFFFWGLTLAPAVDASAIIPVMSPIFTTAFLVLTRRETASTVRVIGLTAGLTGSAIFFVGASANGAGHDRLVGDLLFLLSAVCWAAYSVYGSRLLGGMDPLKATTYTMLSGAVLLGIYAAPSVHTVAWSDVPLYVWLNVAYIIVGPTAVAYLLYYQGIQSVGPTVATTMMFCVPVFGTFCSVAFLGESFGVVQAVGAVVLLAGAFLAVTEGRLPGRGVPPPAGSTARARDPEPSLE